MEGGGAGEGGGEGGGGGGYVGFGVVAVWHCGRVVPRFVEVGGWRLCAGGGEADVVGREVVDATDFGSGEVCGPRQGCGVVPRTELGSGSHRLFPRRVTRFDSTQPESARGSAVVRNSSIHIFTYSVYKCADIYYYLFSFSSQLPLFSSTRTKCPSWLFPPLPASTSSIFFFLFSNLLGGNLVDRLGKVVDVVRGDASNRDSAILGTVDGVLFVD